MNQAAEEVSTPIEKIRRSKNPGEGGFLNAIRNMNGWVRAAIASLGLLGVAETGCAHKPPIIVPHSHIQTERQICIVAEPERDATFATSIMISALINDLHRRYTNITTNYLGKPSDHSVYIENACDDIIHLQCATGKDFGVHTEIRISNMETERIIEADTDRIDVGLFEDVLLKDYHPDQLPPLALAKIEPLRYKEIEKLYAEYEKTRTALWESKKRKLPPPNTEKLKELCSLYLSRFLSGTHIDRIKFILEDVTEGFLRLAEKERKRTAALERGREKLTELRSKLRDANIAENNGQYERAYSLFGDARNAWLQIDGAYRDAQISLTPEIEGMGMKVIYGIQRNADRIGVVRPALRPAEGPSADFDVGRSMLLDMGAAVAPAVGAVVGEIIVAVEKMTPSAGNEPSATCSSCGEIEVQTGSTGYLGLPCTDDGIAVPVPGREISKCMTVGGPGCTIENLAPGRYAVSARRSGGCNRREAGPVEVTVESGQRVKVDFSRNLAR